MALKFSTGLEIYEVRKKTPDQRSDRSLVSESSSVYIAESKGYNLWPSHVNTGSIMGKRKVGTRQIIRSYGYGVDCRPDKPSKSFVSRVPFSFTGCVQITRGRNNPFGRLKNIKISGMEGAGVSGSGSENAATSSEESSDGKHLIMKSPISSSVKNQNVTHRNDVVRKRERKLWKRLPGLKTAIQERVSRPNSKRSEPSILCKRGEEDSITISDKELDASLSAIEPKSSVEHCNYILKLLEKNSDEKTLNFFQWMKSNGKLKSNVTAYNLALRVLSRKEDWITAEALLQEMISDSDCKLSFQVFNTLIYASYKKGRNEYGTKWFRLMLKKGVEPNLATFGMLMSLYQKENNLTEAEVTFARMRKCKLHCHSAYSAMITIYTRLGLYDKSEEIIRAMKEDKVIPNLENWVVQINAYSQQGKLEEAESVLKLMQKARFSPNIVAYNTLITGYGRVGNTNAAQRLFQNLLNIGLEPDETTYRSMVEGFGRADNYKEAVWYYKELKRLGYHPNPSNFYTMINLQAKHEDEEGIIQTLKDMWMMGCQHSSILSSLLQAYERVGRVDKVPFILKAFLYEKILLDQTSCSILVLSYMRHGLVDDALQVLQEKQWTDPIFEDHLYHLLICSCKEACCHENAVKIFTLIPKFESKPNLHITCSMIDIFSAMGRFSEAKELYLKLKASGIKLDMVGYSIVVRMYIKAGSLEDACSVLDAMEKQKGIIPDTFLFFDMLRVYQRCGMLEKLADVYYRILKSRVTWDEAMYNCVINCCSRALPVDELSRLFNEMMQRGFVGNTTTFNVMIDVYGKAGLLKRVRKLLWIARKHHLVDPVTFNTIIAAYGQNKDLRNMRSTFRHMQYAGFPVSLEAYNSMLDAYGKEDRMEEFRDVLQKMKEASCVSDHYTYNIMINIYGKKGWIEEVAAVLAELKEHGLEPDLWSYNTLIKAYGIAGMVEEAIHVVKEMRENGIEPDRVTYINLISALQKNDNFLEAVKWSLWMKQIKEKKSCF